MERTPDAAPTAARHERLADEELWRIDAYWRAANYLSVGQIYLLDAPCCASRSRPPT